MSHEKNSGISQGLVYAGFIGAALLMGRGCTAAVEASYDADAAAQTVEDMGFTEPQVTETNRWFVGFQGCDEKDSLGYEITAVNPQGKEVELLVCKGLFKGATIRQ